MAVHLSFSPLSFPIRLFLLPESESDLYLWSLATAYFYRNLGVLSPGCTRWAGKLSAKVQHHRNVVLEGTQKDWFTFSPTKVTRSNVYLQRAFLCLFLNTSKTADRAIACSLFPCFLHTKMKFSLFYFLLSLLPIRLFLTFSKWQHNPNYEIYFSYRKNINPLFFK